MTCKCAQLLSGFSFDRAGRVLEVGSGCADVTRFLNEHFDEVVSVSSEPFPEIDFAQRFDAVFCIGGLQDCVSADIRDGEDDTTLRRLAELLTPDGVLFLAVEDQIAQLDSKLREHFAETRFYYPYPNCKRPDCVISHEFLATSRAAGLIAEMHARDNVVTSHSSYDDSTSPEPTKDGGFPSVAKSLLVVAGKKAIRGVAFDQLAYLVSSARREKFSTTTRIVEDEAGKIWVKKRPTSGVDAVTEGQITLTRCDSPWVDTASLEAVVSERCQTGKSGLAERGLEQIFAPCEPWVRFLEASSLQRGGERYVTGDFIDCTWDDVFIDGDSLQRVDEEWSWADDIPMNVVVIRAIYYFLIKIEGMPELPRELGRRSGKAVIREVARALGVQLTNADFASFVTLEAAFQSIVFGLNETRYRMSLRWYLRDRASQGLFRALRQLMKRGRTVS